MSYIEDIKNVAILNLPWDNMRGRNLLVTGATGLIGSCLVEVLMARPERDYIVFAMGRNAKRLEQLFDKYNKEDNFYMILGDVTLPLITDQPFHYIIHCASGAAPIEFAQHPVEVMKANLFGVANLMDYGIKHGLKRFLYVSSGEVYGEGDGREFTEDYSGYVDPMQPRSCYPSSKRAAETLCVTYGAEYGVDVVVVRPCHIYGPHFTENDNRVYSQFIRNVLRGENIVMKSTGEQFRSWCYVVDCVSALFHVLLKGENGEAYNVADDGSNISIRQLAEMIAKIGQKKVIIDSPSITEIKGFNKVTRSVFSTQKIKSLGWKPQKGGMEVKMTKTIEYFSKIKSINKL